MAHSEESVGGDASVRIALLTEGGYPYVRGEAVVWSDRLLRGLGGHEFEVYALSRSARQEGLGWCELPGNVGRVRTAALWGAVPGASGGARTDGRVWAADGMSYGRRDRKRFGECFRELAAAICGTGGPADRFASGLYGLADLARERGGLPGALRGELAVRVLQSACRAPGALRAASSARVTDLLAVAEKLERALRPLSLDWYGDGGPGHAGGVPTGHPCGSDGAIRDAGLAAADLCHAVGGGAAALPGLLAKRFFGTPLLITEYGVRLREHYLASVADSVAPAAAGAPVRALLASFQRQLAREAYGRAQLITPGNTHARRWQERCGAPRRKLRTVYPGMDAAPFADLGEEAGGRRRAGGTRPDADAATVVWAGRIEPAKDLIGLLHAFTGIRRSVPGARLRIVATAPGQGTEARDYEARCRALAAQLFPDEAADALAVGESPVTFEELGSHAVPTPADAYGAGSVVVLSSVVEGFPVSLVEAMFCGRATVSTDVGAVCEVIGGTGLVVPSRNPRALADSCAALLRDPSRRERLGAAARERALELFTVEQNVAAFRAIYLELMSRRPVSGGEGSAVRDVRDPLLPFGSPAEARVPGRWAAGTGGSRSAAAASDSAASVFSGTGGAVRVLPEVCAVAASKPSRQSAPPVPPGERRHTRPYVPSWARPDLPDGAPVGPGRPERAEPREGESR